MIRLLFGGAAQPKKHRQDIHPVLPSRVSATPTASQAVLGDGSYQGSLFQDNEHAKSLLDSSPSTAEDGFNMPRPVLIGVGVVMLLILVLSVILS